jgi:predicted lipid-binding transport protein (Tim44 family)
MIPRRYRPWTLALAAFAILAFMATEVDARAGRGFSFGSRGARTFSKPPVTNTAPKAAAPFQRTITQPSAAASGAGRTATTSTGGFLSRPGLLGGLAAGFIGAGLFGLLFGHGLAGGLGGLASILGLLLQIGLVLLVARLIWGWWQRRNQPAYAGASNQSSYSFGQTDYGASSSGASTSGASMAPAADGDVAIEPADYDAFERLLGDIQVAFSNEDVEALRQRTTPEMLGYFIEDMTDNNSRGVVNKISNVKLESGDLAEAWSEGNVEYATVAMRFSLIDYVAERASGRVVDGDATHPTEVTEIWTFRRASGGQWLLAAVQQAEED